MTLLTLSLILYLILIAISSLVLPRKFQVAGIAILTAVFIGYYAPLSLAILYTTSLISFFLIRTGRYRTSMVLTAIATITAILVWFNLQQHINWLVPTAGKLIPLGISYYSFRQIHYIFEYYKGNLKKHDFTDYLCYLFFLPTFLVGPIHRFPDFLRDMNRRRFDTQLISQGLERILYGYFKIVFLANYLVSNLFFSYIVPLHSSHPSLFHYLDGLKYGVNLYFQFSGYSDVAIGFSMIMGFRVIENFNYPFLATNINDFWLRWHISLSGWCRDYIYVPVASLTRKPVLAIMSSMVILGLWHEISWRYLVWALYHGAGIALWHGFQRIKPALPSIESKGGQIATKVFSNFLTMNFVILGFLIVKEPTLRESIRVIEELLIFWK
jgi:D-alanyl-lipoteichoic acid acyltransferase DltB (MBOAT superfamily)